MILGVVMKTKINQFSRRDPKMQCFPKHTHNDGLKSKRRSFFLTAGRDLVSALLLHKPGLLLCRWEVKARTHLQDYSFETSPFQFTKLPSCLQKKFHQLSQTTLPHNRSSLQLDSKQQCTKMEPFHWACN